MVNAAALPRLALGRIAAQGNQRCVLLPLIARASISVGRLEICSQITDMPGHPWQREHQMSAALGMITGRIGAMEYASLNERSRTAGNRGSDRARQIWISVMTGGAIGSIKHLPALRRIRHSGRRVTPGSNYRRQHGAQTHYNEPARSERHCEETTKAANVFRRRDESRCSILGGGVGA
jgi:hypothetical protein